MADKKTQRKSNTGRYAIIIAIVLIILLLLTFALIASSLLSRSTNDRNIIPLFYDGDREIVQVGGYSYIRVEEEPRMVTYDELAEWEINTSVDLFKTAYENINRDITVQSSNGDKVIAPGTENSYEFSLKNTGNISLDFTMRLDSVFTLENRRLPIKVRLHSGDRWIVGNETEWVSPDELSGIVEQGTIPVNKFSSYVFEWQWPYEDGLDDVLLLNDLNDTLMASTAVSQDVVFTLNIETESEITPDAVPTTSTGVELKTPLTLWNTIKYGSLPLGLLLGIGIILIILLRRPIYVAGFLTAGVGQTLHIGNKKDQIRPDGRFVFRKIYVGTHKVGLEESETRKVRFSRSLKDYGIQFTDKGKVLKITVGRRVKAIELYMTIAEPVVNISRVKWEAIDSKHRVLSPDGVKEPVEKANVTEGGLMIDKDGKIDIEEK